MVKICHNIQFDNIASGSWIKLYKSSWSLLIDYETVFLVVWKSIWSHRPKLSNELTEANKSTKGQWIFCWASASGDCVCVSKRNNEGYGSIGNKCGANGKRCFRARIASSKRISNFRSNSTASIATECKPFTIVHWKCISPIPIRSKLLSSGFKSTISASNYIVQWLQSTTVISLSILCTTKPTWRS